MLLEFFYHFSVLRLQIYIGVTKRIALLGVNNISVTEFVLEAIDEVVLKK